MWKNMKIWLLAGMMAVLAAGLGSSAAAAQESQEMDPDKLIYVPSNVEWLKNGTKLVVEGAFYNLSSEYDVIGFEEVVFYMVDKDEKVITTVDVNTDTIPVVPHNGSCTYNFVINDLEGASEAYQRYKAYRAYGIFGLVPKLEAEFNYVSCEGYNCSYCGGSSRNGGNSGGTGASGDSARCTECGGTGDSDIKCTNCDGTGIDPAYEMTKGSVLHAFAEEECSVCGGSGFKKCMFCGGTGEEK